MTLTFSEAVTTKVIVARSLTVVVDTPVSCSVKELAVTTPVMRTLRSITTPGLVLLQPPDLLGHQDQGMTIATLLHIVNSLIKNTLLLITLMATSLLGWHLICSYICSVSDF